MWENLVGRNLSTWRFFYPKLQEEFPDHFGDVPLEDFHRALNKVQPSYPACRRRRGDVLPPHHPSLRARARNARGEIALKDLPEAFDEKMREYLGLQPPDVVTGVLQDVHWSDMSMGYFPTYALGNVISVQLWEKADADLGDLDEQFERGDFGRCASGSARTSTATAAPSPRRSSCVRVTGSAMDPAPYLRYLERKLGDLFGAAVRYASTAARAARGTAAPVSGLARGSAAEHRRSSCPPGRSRRRPALALDSRAARALSRRGSGRRSRRARRSKRRPHRAQVGGRTARLHEERAHQRRPEKDVHEEEGAAHIRLLYRPRGPIGLDLR